MANIMSMASVRNKPSRNGFDLSQKINFTAKVGQLLPVWWQPLLPGDDLNIDLSTFIRSQPLNTAAFARMRGYFDFYFVPYSQLYIHFDQVITQMYDNPQHSVSLSPNQNYLCSVLPYFYAKQVADYVTSMKDSTDIFGFSRAEGSCRLLQYLGYGDFYPYLQNSWDDGYAMTYNLEMSPFSLLAYHKIYSDYYRYTQWESSEPASFNVDYLVADAGDTAQMGMNFSVPGFTDYYNLFDLRYCNWQRDLLHGVIPQAQYGEASVVAVSGNPTVNTTVSTTVTPSGSVSLTQDGHFVFRDPQSGTVTAGAAHFDSAGNIQSVDNVALDYGSGIKGSLSLESSASSTANSVISNLDTFTLSILELRKAEAAQKWKEVSLAAEADYRSQIQAHWNQNVSKYKSGICEYLGGCSVNLSINEVINQNITGDNVADIAGKGTMSGNGHVSYNSADQYGIVMCIFHALPLLDYVTSAPHFGNLLTDAADFPIPEFDSVGMELVPSVRGSNSPGGSFNKFFGYAPRYFDWKTALDRSLGGFSTTLKSWIIPFEDNDLSQDSSLIPPTVNVQSGSVDASFFKVNPHSVDTLFAVDADSTVETDHFLCSSFFDVNVVRSLDTNGLPY